MVAPRRLAGLLGVAAWAVFLFQANLEALRGTVALLDWRYLGWAAILTGANLLAKALRWQFMVRAQSGIRVPLAFAMRSVLGGVAAASLTPGRALDLGKPLLLQDAYGRGFGPAVVGAVAERLLDLFALGAAFALAAATVPHESLVVSGAVWGAVAVVLAAGAVLLVRPARLAPLVRRLSAARLPESGGAGRWASLADKLASALEALSGRGAALLGLSVLALALEVERARLVLQAVGAPFAFGRVALAFSASVLVGLVALIPGGIGVTEVSEGGLLASLGGPGYVRSRLAAGVLLDRFLSYYLLVAAGALVLMGRRSRSSSDREGERAEGDKTE